MTVAIDQESALLNTGFPAAQKTKHCKLSRRDVFCADRHLIAE